jgi:hypothetical protein
MPRRNSFPTRRTVFDAALDTGTLALLLVAGIMVVRGARAEGPERDSASSHVAALEARDRDGRVETVLGEADRARLVFVFRTDCPACSAERERWARLAESAAARGVEVLALTSEPLSDAALSYIPSPQVAVLRVGGPARAFAEALGTQVVPTTLLVADDGAVLARVIGVMPDGTYDELRRRIEGISG